MGHASPRPLLTQPSLVRNNLTAAISVALCTMPPCHHSSNCSQNSFPPTITWFFIATLLVTSVDILRDDVNSRVLHCFVRPLRPPL